MRRGLALAITTALIVLATSCSSDSKPVPTPSTTTELPYAPSAQYAFTPRPTATPRPIALRTPVPPPSEWDESAVWQDYYEGSHIYDECWGQHGIDCEVEVAAAEGVAPAGIAFIEQKQWVLTSFEELGKVDFGTVAWLAYSMNFPQPVFLNGDFGLLQYQDLIPKDWKDADPSYQVISVNGPDIGPLPWGQFSMIAGSSSDSAGQHIVVDTVLQECHACEPVAFMPLEVTFTAAGSLVGVKVLPMKCESEAFPRVDEMAEGPCNQP
jgi:hypothetical protein